MSEQATLSPHRERIDAIMRVLQNGPHAKDLMALVYSWPGSEFADDRNEYDAILVMAFLPNYTPIDRDGEETQRRIDRHIDAIAEHAQQELSPLGCLRVSVDYETRPSLRGAMLSFDWRQR